MGIALPFTAGAQADARPEILVLGTYHMANPARDIYDIRADDVRAPNRQRELQQLMTVLERFRPTKIAVEADVGGTEVPRRYADYVANRYTLTASEVDQIAFRLARELGLATVYPVNEPGDFPYYRVLNYAKANGLKEAFDSVQTATAVRVKQQDDYLRSHTVLETFDYMNADSSVARDVAPYYALVRFGDPYDYAGSDLLASWYQRNIRIYRNIRALATAPGDRILVVYGAGHIGPLQQDVMNDASVRLRKLAELRRKE